MLRIVEHKQRSFFDASYLVPDGRECEFARFYAREILPLVTDRDYEELYSDKGREAVSPALLMHVEVLRRIEGLSDRQAAKAVKVRLDWKVALGLRIDFPGFDATRLVRFRKRFLGGDSDGAGEEERTELKERGRLFFDRLLEKLKLFGFVAKTGQAVRLDSTHVLSAAKNINRYQTIFESLKVAVRELDTADRSILDQPALAPLRDKYSKPMGAYDLKKDRVRKNLEVSVKDAVRLLNALNARTRRSLLGLQSVQLLDKAVRDNVELRRKGTRRKRGRPAKNAVDGALSEGDIASLGQSGGLAEEDVEVVARQTGDRMITPHDPEARLGVKKGGKLRWTGWKLHAAETVPEKRGEPSFIVDGEVTPGNVPDVVETLPTLKRLGEHEIVLSRLYVDAGYVSGRNVALAKSQHGVELYGPPPAPRSSDRLPVEQFKVDFDLGVATCPTGKSCDRITPEHDDEGQLLKATAAFHKATCQGCPLASQCIGKGKSGRTITFTAHHDSLVAQREKARTPEFKRDYKKRSPGEGIFAETAGSLGLRRSAVRGEQKTFFQQLTGLAAINVKRLFKALKRKPEVVPMRA